MQQEPRMEIEELLAPTCERSTRGPRAHDSTVIPRSGWHDVGTDLTATCRSEDQAAVFIAVDHCSAECIGIHAHARAASNRWSRSVLVCGALLHKSGVGSGGYRRV
jgi:hypothetical protein